MDQNDVILLSNEIDLITKTKFDPLFSHIEIEYEVPDQLFDDLDREFCFDLDAAASDENAKCGIYFTKEDNSLEKPWFNRQLSINNIWLNPPYGRELSIWLTKANLEAKRGGTVVVLLPVRTDTEWFHEQVLGKAEIRLLRGRLKFKGQNAPAPFPSMIVVYRPSCFRSM